MHELYFVLTPNFMLLDLAGPAEAFRIARKLGAAFNLHLVSPSSELTSSIGLQQNGLAPLPCPLPDHAWVLLIGVENSLEYLEKPQAWQVVQWLQQQFNPEQHQLACICSGTLLAARAGLLNQRQCTTHHALLERLRQYAPLTQVVENRLFVEDGPIATSAGISSGIDLALHLIERTAGSTIALAVAREMVIWLRRSGHDPQLSPKLAFRNHLHNMVHKAQDLICQSPAQKWTVDALADQVHTSGRNLTRLFNEHAGTSIHHYQLTQRIELARQLLAQPQLSIESVAEQAGFGSARDFRRVWQRETGQLPSASRKPGLGSSTTGSRE